ncbi:MAG: site-2 protease family protein, partial [Patescibacteria group bacterium]
NSIPFGGFVKIFGENPEDGVSDPKSFTSKSKWAQVMVLVAGVLFNMIFAWLLLTGGFLTGMPVSDVGRYSALLFKSNLTIVSVVEGSPAEKAGLKPAGEILFVESNQKKFQAEDLTPETFQEIILNGQGEDVSLLYRNPNETENRLAVITPSFDIIDDKPAIGVSTDRIGVLKLPFWQSLKEGLYMTGSVFSSVVSGFFTLVKDALSGNADIREVTGPVGIIGFIGDASALGFAYLVSFTAFISINLAVINLIPFPALDGGRILFVIIEVIRGKNISPKVANVLNLVGFILLMALMVVVTYNDIARLVS